MLNSMTARAIVPVAVAVTGFVILSCILLYSALKADMIGDAVGYETNLADTVIKSTRHGMINADRETVKNIIENIGSQGGIEHIRIFNKKGLIMFSGKPGEVDTYVDKKAAGCIGCHAGPVPRATLKDMERARRFINQSGTEVIAITSPIYNEPACFNAACHVHTPAQKILGTLDIGLSANHLTNTLATLRNRMIVFSGMILLLTVGGVAALLRRQIFIPLRQIKIFTSKANSGTLSSDISGISGELTDLASDILSMASQLRTAEAELEKLRSMKPVTNGTAAMKPGRN